MSTHLRSTEEMLRALKNFASSSQRLQILRTLPQPDTKLPAPPKTFYILDSSWNPPTRAHFRICTSALLQDRPAQKPKRLLLLLATQNADKAPKPAVLEQRLAMMNIFADELLQVVAHPDKDHESGDFEEGDIIVDVGITKEARFVDKSSALEKHGDYQYRDLGGVRQPTEQVHLIGFDTLIRLLDIKYYPPNHNLQPLEGLFQKHRVRVTTRTEDAWGAREAQDEYMDKIRDGDKEREGGKREWAERIQLVEGREEGEEVVSSTRVRAAAKAGDTELLKRLVPDGVAQWIVNEKLYLEP